MKKKNLVFGKLQENKVKNSNYCLMVDPCKQFIVNLILSYQVEVGNLIRMKYNSNAITYLQNFQ